MPNSALLFALIKTNNISLVTKLMSAKYLNKYAAGKKEHSQVTIKWGSFTDNYRAKTNDRGQNSRVRSLTQRFEWQQTSILRYPRCEYCTNWVFVVVITFTCDNHVQSSFSSPRKSRSCGGKRWLLSVSTMWAFVRLWLPSRAQSTENHECIIADNWRGSKRLRATATFPINYVSSEDANTLSWSQLPSENATSSYSSKWRASFVHGFQLRHGSIDFQSASLYVQRKLQQHLRGKWSEAF